MNPFADVSTATVLSGRGDWVGHELQTALASHPLDCIETEYPHHVGSVDSPAGPPRPAEEHPVFYGCFDWHSAVHSHWSLVRGLRLFEDHPDAGAVRDRIGGLLTDENVARERDYLEDNPSFERPYGWAWLLRLAAELHLWDDPTAGKWRGTLRPLEERVAALVESALLSADRPFRVGTHHNTAFALSAVLDYARTVGDDELAAGAAGTARRFFLADRAYPVGYEPLGWDFLSPALAEAGLMRRVLDAGAFREWAGGFLPDLSRPPHDSLLDPIGGDLEGGAELHYAGLNLSRAWCMADLAAALEGRNADLLAASAERHAEAGLETAFTDDYAGAHWLSSFVLYLLTRRDGGIAPGAVGG